MPTKFLQEHLVPPGLSGPILVDSNHGGRPRFWGSVWAATAGRSLAPSTLRQALAAIEALYLFAEVSLSSSLDEVLGALNFDRIEAILVGYHSYTQNRSNRLSLKSSQNWVRALNFVDCIAQHLASSINDQNRFDEVHRKLIRIRALYASLKPVRSKAPRLVRALPAPVIEDLYSIVDPSSKRNPFRTDRGKWRNYVLFLLYLHQGLRRAEALLLPANVIKEEYRPSENRTYRWINIQDSPFVDTRSHRPSPKTINSIRQVPIAKPLADVTNFFSANWRGKQPHPFLFANNQKSPLSLRSVNYIFDELSACLSTSARHSLESAMHSPKITPHDLRHTCAVVRISHFLEAGDEMEVALQKLRSFFGWSFESEMPRHYAKAHFDDRLAKIWQESFDVHVDVIRRLGAP